MNLVELHRLKPHPKNEDYFADITGEKYEEIKRSIEIHGIRDPLKVLPDFTILAGHQRFRIAKELGLEKVPCAVVDVEPEEAEYLLIADNEERRGDDDNPMRKAKRAEFLTKYWGIQRGGIRRSKGQNVPLKSISDVGESIGEDERTTKRLLKLNDLIVPLQVLVSSGKLGTTAAEQLAYLPVEEQKTLWNAFGESIGQQSVSEVKQLRNQVETLRQEKEQGERAFQQAQMALRDQQRTVEELQQKLNQAQSPSDAKTVQVEIATAQLQIEQLQERLSQAQSEKKLVEAGVERLAEEKAKVLLDKQQAEWDDKLRKINAKNKALNEENQRLSDENTKLAQTAMELKHSEFEKARYRADVEAQFRTATSEMEKAILAAQNMWQGSLQGDGKLSHTMAFYIKRFTEQLRALQQITEARQENESAIIETTAKWN